MRSSLKKSGRLERFYPLFNMHYADTAAMVTIGGMIADSKDAERLATCKLNERFDCVTGEDQFIINVPHLTMKEKIGLDRVLPGGEAAAPGGSEDVPILDEDEIRSYNKFYRYYPVFGEFSF